MNKYHSSDIEPHRGFTVNVGTAKDRFQDGFFAGTLYADTIVVREIVGTLSHNSPIVESERSGVSEQKSGPPVENSVVSHACETELALLTRRVQTLESSVEESDTGFDRLDAVIARNAELEARINSLERTVAKITKAMGRPRPPV